MSVAEAQSAAESFRSDAELKRRLKDFCRTDNFTNFIYIARAWLIIALSIGAAVWFYQYRAAAGLSFWWNVPVTFVAVLIVGASQHQLAGATHEATHHTLFTNKWLNELVSDWLCMFPLFSTTYSFRLYHLLHHQFINDRHRDPDFAVLAESGHWMNFPVSKAKFLWKVFSQIFLVGLVRYTLTRFKYNSLGIAGESPYKVKSKGSKLPKLVSFAFLAGVLASIIVFPRIGLPALMVVVPVAGWLALATFLYFLPDEHYEVARIKPVYHRRWLAISRTGFITLLFVGLSVWQRVSGDPVWKYFLLLWVLPLFTGFPFFMILRQVVQHGNGDRGFVTNTRVFLVNPFVRYAVFPFGMDYHTPHHMYATVPHYRLPDLHEFLANYSDYRDECIVVENYLVPKRRKPPRNPTVVEVVGPEYARHKDEIWIDNSVLEGWDVDEKDREEILKHGRAAGGEAGECSGPP